MLLYMAIPFSESYCVMNNWQILVADIKKCEPKIKNNISTPVTRLKNAPQKPKHVA